MRYKYVKQDNIMDCGVACLLSIIRYYGGDNTVDNIRYLTNCDRNGINAYDLIEASKKLGFESKGIKCDISYLNKVKLPVIAHVFIEKAYKHYVIVHKISKKYIIIFDPAIGIKKYLKEEFINIFSNIIITFNPIRKLDIVKQKINYKLFYNLIKKYKYIYIFIFIVSLISVILNIFSTFYFKLLINNNMIEIIYIIFVFILIFRILIEYLKNYLIIKLYNSVDKNITTTVFNKLISLPNYYFNSKHTGDFINKFNNVKYIVDLFVKVPIVLCVDLSLVMLVLLILITISKSLFFIFFVFVFIYFIIYFIFNKKNKYKIRINQEINGEIISCVEESLDGINTIKNMNLEKYIFNKFSIKYDYKIINENKLEKSLNLQQSLKNLVLFLGINTVLYFGMNSVNNNILEFSNLILFNSLIFYFIEPLNNIFELEEIFKNGLICMKSISDYFGIYKEDGNYTNSIENINIINLNFNYYNKNIFKNFNLNINKKEKIIINGSSGIGKSTLCNMIIKNINTNNIYINNINISDWSREGLLKKIYYISEKEKLFVDTISNNILLNNFCGKKKLNNIVNKVCLKRVLHNKNIDLNSLIFQNGSNFSLGEKQRIIIARCLLNIKDVLILDESLNGVDIKTERKILKNILKMYKEKIVIYITHRKDNLDLFSKKINLDQMKGEKDD